MIENMKNGNSCQTIGCIGVLFVIFLINVLPKFLNWYGDKLNGSYGGLWGLPLILLIIYGGLYIYGKLHDQ